MEKLSQDEIKRQFKLLAKVLNVIFAIVLSLAVLVAWLLGWYIIVPVVVFFGIMANISLAVNYWLSKEGIRDHRYHKLL